MTPTQSIPRVRFSQLATGQQFFPCDDLLLKGVNDLTCYRKTKTGYTNGVTGRKERNAGLKDFLAVDAKAWNAAIHAEEVVVLGEAVKIWPDLDLPTRWTMEPFRKDGWKLHPCDRGHGVDLRIETPDGRVIWTTPGIFQRLQAANRIIA